MKPAVLAFAAALICGFVATDVALAQVGSVRSGDATAGREAEASRLQREAKKKAEEAKAAAAKAAAAAKKGGGAPPDPAALKAMAMTTATTAVKTKGDYCTVTDARIIGQGQVNSNGKVVKTTLVEAACSEGLGYVLSAREDGTADSNDCIAAAQPVDGQPSTISCILPANANPEKALQPALTKTGNKCEIDKAAPIGATPTSMLYEIVCKDSTGVVLVVSTPRSVDSKVTAANCLNAPAAGITCKLTTEEQNLAPSRALLAKSGKTCEVDKQRFVMAGQNGDYFEFACKSGEGFMLQADLKGDFLRTVGCGGAAGIGGGCTLTDAKLAATSDAALYTRLSKAAGFDCNVAKYGVFPQRAGVQEAVELSCTNRPDGGVLVTTKETSFVYNCGRSDIDGFKCSYSPIDAAYKAFTADLKSKNKVTCEVNGLRTIGVAADGFGYVETTCADGGQGFVIKYPKNKNAPEEVLVCSQAVGIGGGCKLASNLKK
ncbi:hypothetical protein BH11PSE2_BH11PSE2_11120 [soil metagenome]